MAVGDKYHIFLNSDGYVISQRDGIRYYQKKRAPYFVNKFGGGDSAYRDATFWQYFVQTNWRNGSKQLKYDDAGKFWKSENCDTSILEELTLSKTFTSAGQMINDGKVHVMEAWRSSVSWWNSNYGYRQQITVTAPAATSVAVGYPVKISVDTAALQSGGKLLANRNDWRVLYFNGSSWVDLTRHYADTTVTFFGLQAAIAAGGSDSNYYIYYGYSSESTNKQPTTTAEWNSVYGMYGTTPDANSLGVWHFKEGTGTSVADDSGNSKTLTGQNTPGWVTDGKLGIAATINGTDEYFSSGVDNYFDLGSFTLEGWFYFPTSVIAGKLFDKSTASPKTFKMSIDGGKKLAIEFEGGGFSGSTTLLPDIWYHLAVYHDGAGTAKVFINGVQDGVATGQPTTVASSSDLTIGRNNNPSGEYAKARMQHLRVSNVARTSFPYIHATEPATTSGGEITTQPPSSSFDLYGGGSDGKVYKWDGTTTWTEQFDARRIVWFESGNDTDKIVGDVGGTETAQAQSFTVPASVSMRGISVHLKKNAGGPSNITVRIETNSTDKPSGTLIDAAATGTIPAFSNTSYGWIELEFASSIALSSGTTYWLVLKTAAAANDQNYAWAADGSSPSYANGTMATSTDGGTTWSAVTAADAYFRIRGNTTEVNCMLVTNVGGTQRLYVGTGSQSGQTNGDARLYSYDGTTWALQKIFATATESMILSMTEYTANSKAYLGIGPQAKVYETSDFSTFTLSKDINIPQNPGYPWAMKEYNRVLHVGGGSPEFLPAQFYNGFLFVYDTTAWNVLYPFDFTVMKSLEFYDAYLFMGTYRGDLYVYDTASLNPLFNFRDQYEYNVEIKAMKYFDDKLYIGTYPQVDSNETNVGIWRFDRRGITLAHTISGVSGYRCFTVVNGTLMVGTGDDGYVYKLEPNTYSLTGFVQSSYFDANLPSIEKLYNKVTVKHDPLLSGQSIAVYYKFKESDSFTLLGTSNTVGAIEKEMAFSTGISSKKISLKYVLTTTDSSSSPKLTEVIMQYSLSPERKWQWSIRVKAKKNLVLLDKTMETRTATEIRTDLEDLLNSEQLYSFIDIDGTTYSVLLNEVDSASWVVNQSDVNEDEVILNLLEA